MEESGVVVNLLRDLAGEVRAIATDQATMAANQRSLLHRVSNLEDKAHQVQSTHETQSAVATFLVQAGGIIKWIIGVAIAAGLLRYSGV